MSYFIHNKYDKDSIANKVVYEAEGHTIIDYYGLLESGDTTYKYVDISTMGTELLDSLTYMVPEGDNSYKSEGKENALINFLSSIYVKSPVKSIQSGYGEAVKSTETPTPIQINVVNPNRCSVRLEYLSAGKSIGVTASLTTHTLTLQSTNSSYTPSTVRYEIIEYES